MEVKNGFMTLVAHDRRFHKNGYREGQSCMYRDGLEKGDKYDSALVANELMKDWISGLSVRMISAREADERLEKSESDIRKYITPKEQKTIDAFVDIAFADLERREKRIPEKMDPNVAYRISEHYFPVMNRCFGMYFGSRYTGPKHIRIRKSFVDKSHHSDSVHLTKDMYKGLLRYLDDPLAVLTPLNEKGRDSLNFIYHIPGLRDKLPGAETDYIVVPVMYNDKNQEDVYLQPLTAYVMDRIDRVTGLSALYMNEKKPAEFGSLRVSPKLFGLPAFTSRQISSLKRKNFSSQMLGSISNFGDDVNPGTPDSTLESNYAKSANEGDYASAFKCMEEYARRRGYVWHSVPDDGDAKDALRDFPFSCFYSLHTGAIKSDDIEYGDDGNLVPLSDRFNARPDEGKIVRGMEDWLSGKRNDRAKKYDAFYRRFVDGAGKTAGWYEINGDSVFLVEGRADARTVAHEIGWHATYEWARKNHPELYKTLRKYAEEATDGVKKAVVEKYGADIGADALLDEIGAERFTRDNMKVIDRASREWWDKVENGQDELRGKYVKANAPKAMRKAELDAISRMEPKKAVEKLVEAMITGRSLGKTNDDKTHRESLARKYLRMVRE